MERGSTQRRKGKEEVPTVNGHVFKERKQSLINLALHCNSKV